MELQARSNPGILQPKLSKDGKKVRKLPPLNRQCVVVTMNEVTKELVEHLVDARRVGGLLVIIPEEEEKVDVTTMKNWRTLETWIMSRELKVPIYFAIESEHTSHLVDLAAAAASSSSHHAQSGDDYLLKASVVPSKKIVSPSLQNVQGWMGGESKEVDSEHLPTIAVVGHYDSFGVVPGLASGGGDGAVVVLELARMFAKAYKKKKGEYNLLFLLTSGGHMNFGGTRDWLEQLDVQLMDSIDFVICLEDLEHVPSDAGDAAQLYLHYSKNPKDPMMKKLLDVFTTSSSSTISLHQQRKKIQLKNTHLAWQHEQFALKRIVGVTLSSQSSPTKLFGRSCHFTPATNPAHFKNIIHLISKGISSFVYPTTTVAKDVEVEEEVEVEVEDQVEVEVEDDNVDDDVDVDDKKKNKKNKKKTKMVTRLVKKKIKKMVKKVMQLDRSVDTVLLKADEAYIATWSAYFRNRARVAPFLSSDTAHDLEKALKYSNVKETSVQTFVLDENDITNFAFYNGHSGSMSALLVKDVMFDLKMSLLNAVYLGAMWLYILVLKEGWAGARLKFPLGVRKFLPKPASN